MPDEEQTTAHISVDIPNFWPRNVELWIARCEAEFDACKITRQETKFNLLQRVLPDEYAEELCDLLICHPKELPYDKLKGALIKRIAMTEERRLRQLLTGEELGDRKPSQLLRRIQVLIGERKFEASILRQLFLQRLPLDVQTILAVSQGSIEELAELADKVMALRVTETYSVSKNNIPATDNRIDRLEQLVAQLTSQLSSIAVGDSRQSRNRWPSRDRRRSSSRSRDRRQPSPSGLCWYHNCFGARARRCARPCSYISPPMASGNDPTRQ